MGEPHRRNIQNARHLDGAEEDILGDLVREVCIHEVPHVGQVLLQNTSHFFQDLARPRQEETAGESCGVSWTEGTRRGTGHAATETPRIGKTTMHTKKPMLENGLTSNTLSRFNRASYVTISSAFLAACSCVGWEALSKPWPKAQELQTNPTLTQRQGDQPWQGG